MELLTVDPGRKPLFQNIVTWIENRYPNVKIDRTDEKEYKKISDAVAEGLKRKASEALARGALVKVVPGTGQSLDVAPLMMTKEETVMDVSSVENREETVTDSSSKGGMELEIDSTEVRPTNFYLKSLKSSWTMDETSALKTLINRGYAEEVLKNPALMKILAVVTLKIKHKKTTYAFMEDAKRGLPAYEKGDCQVRSYDIKGLPHRRKKYSSTKSDERMFPKTGVDGDFFEEQAADVKGALSPEQCDYLQGHLRDAIRFLTPMDSSTSTTEKMIDYSIILTITKGESCVRNTQICTPQGTGGCFVGTNNPEKQIQIGFSVIDYLNNFNGYKRAESSSWNGYKFHRYAEYVSAFVGDMCTASTQEAPIPMLHPNADDEATDAGLLRGPERSRMGS
eukprot:g271.t1